MQIGDRVKPVDTFNFDVFTGPNSLEDRGTVVEGLDDSCVWVLWDSSTDPTDHSTAEDGDYSFRNFGVVLVDAA